MTGKEPARTKLKVSVPSACSRSTPRQYMVDSVCLVALPVMCHTACYCYTNQNHRKEMGEAHGQCSSSQARPWLPPPVPEKKIITIIMMVMRKKQRNKKKREKKQRKQRNKETKRVCQL